MVIARSWATKQTLELVVKPSHCEELGDEANPGIGKGLT